MVIDIGCIRYNTYDFILVFHCIYITILHFFSEILGLLLLQRRSLEKSLLINT